MKKFLTKHSTLLFIFFCLAMGFFLRAYNTNWDEGLLFHPDERNIANAVTKIHFFTQLNPQFFAYGGFSVYLYRAAGDILDTLTHVTVWVNDWGKINDIGRFFSAFFSTLTLIPLFFVARKLFGKIPALLACLFYTFTVTSIQHAHFATTESSLTFFALTLCLLAVLWTERPTMLKTILFGSVFGISLATKTSAALFGIFPFIAFLLFTLNIRKTPKKLFILLPYALFFGLATGLFFFVLSPYTLLDFRDFYASMHYESGVATGTLPVVYTLQFNGSIPYIFQIENFLWQMGPLLTIFGVMGFVFLIAEPIRKKEKNRLLFWVFPLFYFLYIGSWHTKFLRYMVPVIPFFLIAASYLLVVIKEKFVKLGNTLILITLLTTVCWAFAFFSIYVRPQTRIVASIWMYQHIPANATILTESWDDGLPAPLGSLSPSIYHEQQLDMYSTDNAQKIIYLATMLHSADYVSISSKRLYATLMRLTIQYPITSAYYHKLFSGKLGFTTVATFTSYPQLFGLQLVDDSAEETFQVFDHTKILLFKNTKHYSVQQLENILHQGV